MKFSCCDNMKECLHLWSDKKAGLVKVSLINNLSGKIRDAIGYRKKSSMRDLVYTVNYCPFCGDQKK